MDINNIDELSVYPSNCLALTVKNNYKLTIGKNVMRKGSKFSIRIFFHSNWIKFIKHACKINIKKWREK